MKNKTYEDFIKEKTKKIIQDDNIQNKVQKINGVFDEVFDVWTKETDLKCMGF